MKIGFIGTGTMGQPMLANLVKKGFQAIAYDTAPGALDAAVRLGAERAGSAAQAAAAAELVITMLPSSANVEAAYLGAGGIIEGAAAGRLCVDMSTIDPGTSQRVAARLKERGLRFLDAPVSGGVGGAAAGTLAIMVGGDAVDLAEARPVLAAMGSNIIHVGAVGAGDGAAYPTRDRCIEKPDALLFEPGRHPLRGARIDRRHVDAEPPGHHTFDNPTGPQIGGLDIRRRRQHRNHQLTGCRGLCG